MRIAKSPIQTITIAIVLFAAAAVASADAQVGVTTDIITGVVIGADGAPLENVLVSATSMETEITRQTRTDGQGRYTILFPDGGGQYRLIARAIGVAPQEVLLVRHADEDRLVWNVQLADPGFILDPIEVTAQRRPVRVPDPPTPGSVERNFTTSLLAGMPLDIADLNILATLVPGVVGFDATDSSAAAFSVAGQRPDANAITLDGLNFGSGQVPQEGLRNTRVVTSTYDVSRGGFSGGLIASTSRGGSNLLQGSFGYSVRDDGLAFETGESSPFTSGFSQHQLSGGLGGPLVHNRLFVFVSGQARLRNDPQPSLTSATITDLQRLGVSPDSVNRFIRVVDGVGAAPDTRVDRDRSNDRYSTLIRADFLASNSHTLMVRGDWRGTRQEPSQISALSLPETGGLNESGGSGVMATLSSRLGVTLINEARIYGSTSNRDGNPFLYAPQGRVQVASELDDGAIGINTLVFGGNTRMPISSNQRSFEITNELSWLPGTGEHRFKLGVLLSFQRSEDILSTNQLGIYTFNSLADVESGTPASFRRTLAPNERSSKGAEYAVYVGDVWRVSRSFQFTYGLRMEGTRLFDPPEYNADLDARFGVATNRLPSELDASPRAGFTWTLGNPGFGAAPVLIVRGGVGRFRSPLPSALVAQAQSSTGFDDSQLILSCVGSSVPTPAWNTYGEAGSLLPEDCVGPAQTIASRAPGATVFTDSFGAPKSWRASLGFQRNLTSLLRLSVNGSYARGVSQYGFRDLNLNTTPQFGLANEASRPVFVDPADIVPVTGAINLTDSRIDPNYSQVLEVGSDLESETKQLTVSLGGITNNGVVLQTSYSWSNVRDQSSQSSRFGNGRLAGTTTSGDPNIREWSRSSYERRHSFLTTISYPFGTSLEITAIGRFNSGTPYTPIVGADINGDGARNDHAFIFDPNTVSSPAVASGFERLLASTTGGARRCLERQLNVVAARNSCVGPWQASLDFQVNFRPRFLGLDGNVSMSLTTVNLLRGIDELLHGADGVKGWGLNTRPNNTLLFVDGFDVATQSFQYSVNERFGATNVRANAFRVPFQIGIQIRVALGPNRGQAALDRIRGGGMRGGGFGRRGGAFGRGLGARGRPGGGITGDDFLSRFLTLLVNPAEAALALRDTLQLTGVQVEQLTAMRDSLTSTNDSLAADLQREIEEVGGSDPRALLQVIRPRLQEAQRRIRESRKAVRDVLTEEQWNRLPEDVKAVGR